MFKLAAFQLCSWNISESGIKHHKPNQTSYTHDEKKARHKKKLIGKKLAPWAKFSLTQENKDMYYIIGSENFTLQWTTKEHPKQAHYELLQAVTYI